MMNKLLILIAALSTPAMAEPVSCDAIGQVAESIMMARQAEQPISKVMALVDGHGMSAVKPLVIEAYKRSSYSTESYQKKAIAEFRNDIELICYEGK
ncbi:hypothetical protein NVP1210O_06 [Vibrio phage 1.210.O._10N.222.52.C2]|nr:hypothetical protein NVP1210O_06 [Vibrio phage 1.210.O._10N.222.52.C2]